VDGGSPGTPASVSGSVRSQTAAVGQVRGNVSFSRDEASRSCTDNIWTIDRVP
jgi:hypothetical protein